MTALGHLDRWPIFYVQYAIFEYQISRIPSTTAANSYRAFHEYLMITELLLHLDLALQNHNLPLQLVVLLGSFLKVREFLLLRLQPVFQRT